MNNICYKIKDLTDADIRSWDRCPVISCKHENK